MKVTLLTKSLVYQGCLLQKAAAKPSLPEPVLQANFPAAAVPAAEGVGLHLSPLGWGKALCPLYSHLQQLQHLLDVEGIGVQAVPGEQEVKALLDVVAAYLSHLRCPVQVVPQHGPPRAEHSPHLATAACLFAATTGNAAG